MSVHRLNTTATQAWHRQTSPVGQARAHLARQIPARDVESEVNAFGDARAPRERGQDADAIDVRAAWDRLNPEQQAETWAELSHEQRAGVSQALAWSHRIGLANAGQAHRFGPDAAEPVDQHDAIDKTITHVDAEAITDEDWDWYGW